MSKQTYAAPNIETRLLMTFATTSDKKVSLSITDPRTDLTEQEIKTCMDLIVSSNIFAVDGLDLNKTVEAKVIMTDTTEYDLEI